MEIAAILSVVAVSVVTYLPAVGNSFISDDFTMLPFLKRLMARPADILQVPSEIFRATSYLYFWICLQLFGKVPEAYYWCGILLHCAVSLLVYHLVKRLVGSIPAAWVAAVFFAAYERHQEAVMWISAANETVLTLGGLAFLALWDRAVSKPGSSWAYAGAVAVFPLVLFSKEPAVMLVPLALALLWIRGSTWREALKAVLPILAMVLLYGWFWIGESSKNFFVTEKHYDLSLHFFPVYGRSLLRIFSPLLLLAIPLLVIYRRRGLSTAGRTLVWGGPVVFFVLVTVLTAIPYSFLTYLDHIPSRNTYLPSVGLAGLIGVLFAGVYAELRSSAARQACAALMAAVVVGNMTYIYLKKEPQFRSRAAPTRELLSTLTNSNNRIQRGLPVYVCSFPLHTSIGKDAVSGFTSFGSDEVLFPERCEVPENASVLRWDEQTETYVGEFADSDLVD